MTIEERATQAWGLTNNPICCIYMLTDGTMLNGSYEGFQRDRDHREIGQFYKKSKLESPGDSSFYLYKFMRRGNLRVGCSQSGFIIKLLTTPTDKQLCQIVRLAHIAQSNHIEFGIGIVNRKQIGKVRFINLGEYINYLLKHHMFNEYRLHDIINNLM